MNSLTLIALASIAAPIFAVQLEANIDMPSLAHDDYELAQTTT